MDRQDQPFDAAAWQARLERRRALIEGGAYDPAHEHDACGVGIIASIDGEARREVVELAIGGLKAVRHRGAVAADGLTGDGAGVRFQVSQDFFRREAARGGKPYKGEVGVGMVFLPRTDHDQQDSCRALVEAQLERAGFTLLGWRPVPINPGVIGQVANQTRPEIEQVLFADPKDREDAAAANDLFVARRRMEKMARAQNLTGFYLCSLSFKDVIYKGMILGDQIDAFYPDLRDSLFESNYAIFHQRYSTNTFPEWRLAQPFRFLAHNGEINTLKGNLNWLAAKEARMTTSTFGEAGDAVKDIVEPGASDSAALDHMFELLVRSGRTAAMAKAMLIPEAWSKRAAIMPAKWRALYEYCNAVIEPWDGPAAIAACDGRWAVAGLDRNGLRPLRYTVTKDGLFCAGSETGLWGFPPERIEKRGAVSPGRMIAVDLRKGQLYGEDEILDRLAAAHPYEKWLGNIRAMDQELWDCPCPDIYKGDVDMRTRRFINAGLTYESLDMVVNPMVVTGKEAVGSMGDDAALAVLSKSWRPLAHFFRQNFSQVTNPPIDPLREDGVMSLKTRFKNLGNILVEDETQTDVFTLDSPVLANGMARKLREAFGAKALVIDCTLPLADVDGSGVAFHDLVASIKRQARAAVDAGVEHLILSDWKQGPHRLAGPMVLITSAVHADLAEAGLRAFCSLNVRSGEVFDSHGCAVLIGMGATTVNPYNLFEAVRHQAEQGKFGAVDDREAVARVQKALDAGLLKIMSKMGVSVISSYRGGRQFDALGLGRGLVARYFPGVASRVSGVSMEVIETKTLEQHRLAFAAPNPVLPIGGFYRVRSSGELHALDAKVIHTLQKACRDNDPDAYERYRKILDEREPLSVRDLLDPVAAAEPTPLEAVEGMETIRQRMVTPGMSLGALSPEAHGALNIAMNRIGGRSVSGEGGEDPERYTLLPNGDNANSKIKQVASGRFGVTAEYLNQCEELEIKVAQGAKPGEGGQLPGFKVTDFIARMRHSTPGVTLISPPPHHDIYSIEDLAQLIYDLKQINPRARVCVKLVSAVGVGTIAAGVAKAAADVIHIAGHSGGTGASPQTSIKFAGLPFEIGLAEAHQQLMLNDLRDRVRLRADGGLKTGLDIVRAALLGADEYALGTMSLVALGCLMVRQCHSNVCPVGVCTQRDDLRERFMGAPEHVINYLTFLAEDVRRHIARLGAKSLNEIVGRMDLLEQTRSGERHLQGLDLKALLLDAGAYHRDPDPAYRPPRIEVPGTLDQELLDDIEPYIQRGQPVRIRQNVYNFHRSVGARISSEIVRRFGPHDAPEPGVTLELTGSAGQSLGAFAAKGLRIEVTGDANDYVGKGLSGATLVVKPHELTETSGQDALIGNTCLYGATSGRLFAAGRAGERFAVRNSGAVAVVEGVGANGCEYMTGGVAVILGPVGDNFAAGMTGGQAFVLDEEATFGDLVNAESVFVKSLDEDAGFAEMCRNLIAEHLAETGSPKAKTILKDWETWKHRFVWVLPKEIADKLSDFPIPAEGVAAE